MSSLRRYFTLGHLERVIHYQNKLDFFGRVGFEGGDVGCESGGFVLGVGIGVGAID